MGSNLPSDLQSGGGHTSAPQVDEAQPSSSSEGLTNSSGSEHTRVRLPFAILYHRDLYYDGVWCDPQGRLAPPDLPRLLELTDEESQRTAGILSAAESHIQDHYIRHTKVMTAANGDQYFRIDPMGADEVEALRASISKDIRDIGLSPRIADLLATKYIDRKKRLITNALEIAFEFDDNQYVFMVDRIDPKTGNSIGKSGAATSDRYPEGFEFLESFIDATDRE